MAIHLYAICWNDIRILDFFFRHYDPLVDRFVMYDDGSTDGTLELLRSRPKVEVRRFERKFSDSLVLSGIALENECWKESRTQADWVIVVNVDEHLFHPRIEDYLKECQGEGITVIPTLGYQMMSRTFPPAGATLCQTVTLGAPWKQMSKLLIFNPDAVREVNYTVGRHTANPEGDIHWPARDEMMHLHYKYLGFEYTFGRHQELKVGFQEKDLRNGWGLKYHWTEDELTKKWQHFEQGLVDITNPNLQPWHNHTEPRWWQPLRASQQDAIATPHG